MEPIPLHRVTKAAKIIRRPRHELLAALAIHGIKVSGPRVMYSNTGIRELSPHKPDRAGEFLGVNRNDGNMVRVLWDGKKTPEYVHRSFIVMEN